MEIEFIYHPRCINLTSFSKKKHLKLPAITLKQAQEV